MSSALVRGRSLLANPALHAELGRAVGGILQFVILTRALGLSDYGRLAVINAVAAMAYPAVTVRLNVLLIRSAAHGSTTTRLLQQCRRGAAEAAVAGGLLLLALQIVGWLPAALVAVVLIFASELVLAAVSQGVASIAQGRNDLPLYRRVVNAQSALRATASLVFLAAGGSTLVGWAVTLAVAMAVCALVLYLWAVRWSGPLSGEGERDDPHDTWVFVANAVGQRVVDESDKTLLAVFASYGDVGAYAAAYRLSTYVLVPVRATLSRALPKLFAAGKNEGVAAVEQVRRRASTELLLACLVGVPALWAAAGVLPLVLGDEYSRSRSLTLVLAPALALRGFHFLWGDLLVAIGSVRTRLMAQLVSTIIPVSAYVVLIPAVGVWGAVLGTALGELATIAVMRSVGRRALASGARHADLVAT